MKSLSTTKIARLLVALASLAMVWLVVLPLIGRQPAVSQHIAQQQELGINPSALFYSELEFLPDVVHRIERMELHVPANVMGKTDEATAQK